ncbi:hypothetical protein FLONG3_3402 [Fusarium longipes]|uniref:Uncharacterized protein n=1 Tax=Fusarium longipes TaxID=694270 RepID=A0A395T1D8_9HYPO|nr:hypothetical protein FLONG3_3402 [Fusarium longipes]
MPQSTTQTIDPALLMQQASNAPPSSNRPLNPVIASRFTGSVQKITPSSSPYPYGGRQGAWMGSVGFTTRFTRASMGYGVATQENQVTTYESEPLQPLFGSMVPLSPLPEPTSANTQTQSRDSMGGDMAWLFGQPRSGYVQRAGVITCNVEQRRLAGSVYISRSFREAGMSR